MKLKVSKKKALDVLQDNKQRHLAEYELQMEAWKAAYKEHTENLNEWAQEQSTSEKGTVRPEEPQKPKYHGDQYDTLIRKLRVHEEELLELDASTYGGNEYEQIFENRFEWSRTFGTLSANYVTTGHLNADTVKEVRGE